VIEPTQDELMALMFAANSEAAAEMRERQEAYDEAMRRMEAPIVETPEVDE